MKGFNLETVGTVLTAQFVSHFGFSFQTLREEIVRMKATLAEANHRMNRLEAFRGSVARLLHLRDLPEADLLHRLQTLCNAHQEFTLLSHKYEGASPVPTPCPRFNDHHAPPVLPAVRPTSSGGCGGGRGGSSISVGQNLRRFDDFHDHHFEDDFEFGKKY